jgi:hypothetical protein
MPVDSFTEALDHPTRRSLGEIHEGRLHDRPPVSASDRHRVHGMHRVRTA